MLFLPPCPRSKSGIFFLILRYLAIAILLRKSCDSSQTVKFFSVIFLIIASILVFSAVADTTAADLNERFVTASDYCAFLNAVAVTDMDHLYDEKLGSDPISACIVRSGKPGVYHYDVIAGREIFLISYTSLFDKARYCNAMPTGAEAMAWQANGEDIFLTSNRSDFCVTASSASQQLTVDWNKFMPKEGTWTEWESTTKGIIITASICFSLYRFIKYYKAVPTGEVINTESIRADVDTVGHNGARSFVEVPSRMENVDEEPSSEVSSSHGDEKEQKILTLKEFHNERMNTSDPNIRKFHESCSAADKIERRLELIIEDVNRLNEEFKKAQEDASQAVLQYAKVAIVTKAITAAVDLFVPGISMVAHFTAELGGNQVVHVITTETASYALGTAKGSVVGKMVRPMIAEDPSVTTTESSETDLVAWAKWGAGPDIRRVTTGVQTMKSVNEQLADINKDFLTGLQFYEEAMTEIDRTYAIAVENEYKKKRAIDKVGASQKKNPTEARRQSSYLVRGDTIHEFDAIPQGAYGLTQDRTYYRIYAAPHDGEDPNVRSIGAHLLVKKPKIHPGSGILIQQVRLPAGIRWEPVNYHNSSDLQDRLTKIRLIDILLKDVFIRGLPPEEFDLLFPD